MRPEVAEDSRLKGCLDFKASLYAMLFAIPLALMGAAYTAYFMSPQLRKWVKPGIEIMAALPTVILGFLAGLWFAPWVEKNLMDLLLMLLIIPPGLTAFAWLWHRLNLGDRLRVPEGWEPLLLAPAIIGLGFVAAALADPIAALACNRVFPGHRVWTRDLRLDFRHESRSDMTLRFELRVEQERGIAQELACRGRSTPEFEYAFFDRHGRACVLVNCRGAIRPAAYRPHGV